MEHSIRFENGHDCIRFKCIVDSDKCILGGGGSHGRHGLTIRFVSQGKDGAVQFVLFTGWLPQYTQPSKIGLRELHGLDECRTIPADLGYHSKNPRYEGQKPVQKSCEFCDGQPCYYDGSGLNANDAMYALCNGGHDALWEFLDAYYETVFNDAAYPIPAEFAKNPREKGE